jgi:trans-aconitate methyltransferase
MDDAALSLWLRLREQRDWKARSVDLTNAIVARLPDDRPVGVIDLATGAGSNLRYLVERLPPHQRWLLIDRSAALLSEAGTRTRAWAAERGYDVGLRTAANMGLSISGPQLDCEVDGRVQNLATLDDP